MPTRSATSIQELGHSPSTRFRRLAPSSWGITAGPDGARWFTEYSSSKIGRITTTGSITEYPIPSMGSFNGPIGIVSGPDGNPWFTEESGIGAVGKITTAGATTQYPIPRRRRRTRLDHQWSRWQPCGSARFWPESGTSPQRALSRSIRCPAATLESFGITSSGPDGALWFAETSGALGRVTTSGTVTQHRITGFSLPQEITVAVGPDGALWVAEDFQGVGIGRFAIVQPDSFFTGEQELGTIFYLQFQDSIPFGYYGLLQGLPRRLDAWLYHFDLGYEYVTAGDANGDLYFYDRTSNHWWYTSSNALALMSSCYWPRRSSGAEFNAWVL